MSRLTTTHPSTFGRPWWLISVSAVGVSLALLITASLADVSTAADTSIDLAGATPFAVLAGTTVTNTGSSTVTGDLGVSPGSAITGFPPGTVSNGSQYAANTMSAGAEAGLTAAYIVTAGRTPFTAVPAQIGQRTLVAGTYENPKALQLTGTVTLNAQGDPNAVFVFQAGTTLTTASSSTVALIGGAQACNVFWQVGSSATIGTGTTFVGTVMALTSISVQTGATVAGRVLARNGQVSLDTNTITAPTCAAVGATTTTSTSNTTSTTSSSTTTGHGVGAGTTTTVIPTGAPGTGFGGATHASGGELLWIGGVALVVGAGVVGEAIRRSGQKRHLSRGHSDTK